ncbi:MAG TPA: JAB domain-containing protein [Bacteroidetes bacterium]|nr:JAB domain-containing protein [Bacteroidota bacterium]
MTEANQKLPISQWAEDDRPREKLMAKGKGQLSKVELIAILIASGNTEESAVQLAQRILTSVDNNLAELAQLSVKELTKFKGIGQAKAISIVAALELGKRRLAEEVIRKKKITSSADAFHLFYADLSDKPYEAFRVIFLDRANQVISSVSISEGGMAGTVADPKKIFKLALESNAHSLILGHNHPSNNLKPSPNDIKLTNKLKKAGDHLDIQVLDHLIIGNDSYYSFADEGMM